ncbi:MAG: amino acid permease [Euzebyales bacterium]|nr:amino acid permease [Euzebyales bacterium]
MTPQEPGGAVPSRLSRRLGLGDAVIVGLGAMVGAGIFSALGPAAAAAGAGLLLGLVVAAFVAFCNATSSAQLAAVHPESGGTYVYGRRRLGHLWGWLAGWGFVTGKLASCAAMALTFGAYAAPSVARPLAVAAVAAVTAVNYRGVHKTALVTRVIVAVVLGALAAVVAASLLGGRADPANLLPLTGSGGARGVLRAAGLLFFAFAGYARLATLGEEVVDPRRTIPRAITLALGVTLVVYATVAVSALLASGPQELAEADAPLAAAVEQGRLAALSPVVRLGATVASLGVLLSLIVGVSRTAFAMAGAGDLPQSLAAVHPRYAVPHRAELLVGALVGVTVALVDLRQAIGFSAFAVLVYYGITNAAALTLDASDRRWPRWLAAAGLAGCALLGVNLPPSSVLAGGAVLLAGALVFGLRRR